LAAAHAAADRELDARAVDTGSGSIEWIIASPLHHDGAAQPDRRDRARGRPTASGEKARAFLDTIRTRCYQSVNSVVGLFTKQNAWLRGLAQDAGLEVAQ
jgi:hypothetical protein